MPFIPNYQFVIVEDKWQRLDGGGGGWVGENGSGSRKGGLWLELVLVTGYEFITATLCFNRRLCVVRKKKSGLSTPSQIKI